MKTKMIMRHFIRIYTVCKGKNNLQGKKYNFIWKLQPETPWNRHCTIPSLLFQTKRTKSISASRVKTQYGRERVGTQWLSGRVLDSRPRGREFESHRRHCIVSLSKNFNPSLVLFQHRKTRPLELKDWWWGVKNQIKQTNKTQYGTFYV